MFQTNRRNALLFCAFTLAALAVSTLPAMANVVVGTIAWNDLKPDIFGSREILDGKGKVILNAPYRADDQRSVPVSASINLGEGRQLKSVTLIVDEDPAPVAAVFNFPTARDRVAVSANLRLNGPSLVRAVAEDTNGNLYMTETLVKVSGLGACASPPVTDQEIATRTLGKMTFADVTELARGTQASSINHRARLEIMHPNNSGLQMNQITLLYIPARYIDHIEISQGDVKVVDITGSISLSENPVVEFDYRMGGSGPFNINVSDSDGTKWQRSFEMLQGY